MAYSLRDNKPVQTNDTTMPAPQAASAHSNANAADLKLLLAELNTLLRENRNADEILMANLEGWTDLVAEALTESFVEAVKPALIEQNNNLEKISTRMNALTDEVKRLKRVRGFKNFLIWLSILCNIGLAGFGIYLLVKGVVL